MGKDEDNYKRVPILARDNHETWFLQAKFKLQAKGVYYTVETTKVEYAWIKKEQTGKAATTPSTSTSTVDESIENLTSSFERIGGTWNIDKAEKYDQDQAKVFAFLVDALDRDDQALLEGSDITAKQVWTHLKAKYSKTSESTVQKYMTKIQTFEFDKDKGIDAAWDKLKEYRRKMEAGDPALKATYPDKTLLNVLTRTLPKEFTAILDGFRTNQSLAIDERLKILVEKEEDLKDAEKAYWSRRRNKRDSRRSSDTSMKDDSGKQCCYLCGEEHWARDCDLKEEILKYGKKLRKEMLQKVKDSKSKKSSMTKDRNKKRSKSTKENGYSAANEETNSDKSETSSSSDSDSSADDDETVEKVHLSREKIREATPADWIFDTGATRHMSNQVQLFRNLKQIPTVTIQCGGGDLVASQCGTVQVVCEDGSWCEMKGTLFVPELGVNLISAKRLCKKGLKGSFDKHSMYVSKDDQVAILAKQKDGLYIVSHVSSRYKGKAFIAHRTKKAFPAQAPIDVHDHDEAEDTSVDPDDSEVEEATKKSDRHLYRLLHRRFAHYGPDMISKLHKVTTLKDKIKIPPKERRICKSCKIGKMRNRTSRVLAEHKKEALQLVSLDIAGPLPTSLRGNRYFMQIIDNYTRKNWSIPLKSKDEAMSALRSWRVKEERQTGREVKAARSDNAPELKNVLDTWEKEDGIRANYTTIATSNQNGPAERSIQTAENAVRTMLDDAELPMEFWDEAVETDAYIRNRLPTGPEIDGQITCPEQAYTGEKPNILNIRVWGSKAYDYVNPKTLPAKARHDKLVQRGREGVFMGYSDNTEKHFRVYAPDLGYTRLTSVLLVDERVKGGTVDLKLRNNPTGPQGTPNDLIVRKGRGRPAREHAPEHTSVTASSSQTIVVETPFAPLQKGTPVYTEDKKGNLKLAEPEETIPVEQEVTTPAERQEPEDEPMPDQPADEPLAKPEKLATEPSGREYFLRKRKRSVDDEEDEKRLKIVKAMIAAIMEQEADDFAHPSFQLPSLQRDTTEGEVVKVFLAALEAHRPADQESAFPAKEVNGIKIPNTYNQAVTDEQYAAEWKAAVQEEVSSLVKNGTWAEVILPEGANLVSTKWVFAIKTLLDGTIERFKARLVARGFSQQYGLDYLETFAPTVRMDTLRLFFAMVAKKNLDCWHFDIKNAFTESELREDIYLAPPQGVQVTKGHVLKALKSLYGLKQAGRDWSLLLRKFLLESGFEQSLADPCLYVHPDRQLYMLVYVDDIPAAGKPTSLEWFAKTLSTRFNAKNLGEISKLLGMRIIRDRKSKTIYLDQEQYLMTTLNRYGISAEKHKAKKIPAADYEHLRPAAEGDEMIDPTEYSQIVGSLMWAMVLTRPDIAFVLGRLSQYMSKPAKHHGSALKSLMRYIRSTVKQKLRFGPGGAHENQLAVYTDADWASDKSDRKSISGGIGMFYGGPILWASKKQNSVATSSTESEYISQAMFAKNGQWAAQILRDLMMPECAGKGGRTVQMYGDNQGALALVKNPELHERSKHIDICHHFIRDLAEKKKLQIDYIPTTEMIADGLTKPLGRIAFERFKDQMSLGLLE
jgi:hypothetical protein